MIKIKIKEIYKESYDYVTYQKSNSNPSYTSNKIIYQIKTKEDELGSDVIDAFKQHKGDRVIEVQLIDFENNFKTKFEVD